MKRFSALVDELSDKESPKTDSEEKRSFVGNTKDKEESEIKNIQERFGLSRELARRIVDEFRATN